MKSIGESIVTLFVFSNFVFGQKIKTIDLLSLQKQEKLEFINRTVSINSKEDKTFINISEDTGEGLVLLPFQVLKTRRW